MTNILSSSWKTSVAGIATIVASVCTALSAQLDGNPATVPDWAGVITIATVGVGLLFARDHDKEAK